METVSPCSSPGATRPALQPSDKHNRPSAGEDDKFRSPGRSEPVRAFRMEMTPSEPTEESKNTPERNQVRTSGESSSRPRGTSKPRAGRRAGSRGASRTRGSSGRGSRSSGRSSGEGSNSDIVGALSEEQARVMLETVQQQHVRLKETYKAQLSIEKADRKELERLLKEEQAKREAAERDAAAAQREKDDIAAQTKEREMKEMIARQQSELDAQRAKLMAEMAAFRYERDNYKHPSPPAQVQKPSTPRRKESSRGSSTRSRSVNFADSPEMLECREASPTRSWIGSAVNTTMTLAGAAVAIPIVGGLLAVDAIKYVRGGREAEAGDSKSAEEHKEKTPTPTNGQRRRWSIANDMERTKMEVFLDKNASKEEAIRAKMSVVD